MKKIVDICPKCQKQYEIDWNAGTCSSCGTKVLRHEIEINEDGKIISSDLAISSKPIDTRKEITGKVRLRLLAASFGLGFLGCILSVLAYLIGYTKLFLCQFWPFGSIPELLPILILSLYARKKYKIGYRDSIILWLPYIIVPLLLIAIPNLIKAYRH